MSDEIPLLLDEDYVAAREVVENNAAALKTEPTEEHIELLAQQCAMLGAREFRVLYGVDLPRHVFERLVMEYRTKRISLDQYQDRWREFENQPMEISTLRAYFDELDTRVIWYGRLLQLALEPVDRAEERAKNFRAERFVAEINRRLSLPSKQLQIITEFLGETRAEQRWGLACIGRHSAACAGGLVREVTHEAVYFWKKAAEIVQDSRSHSRYVVAGEARQLFSSKIVPGLPKPKKLQVELDEEFALARWTLQQRNNPAHGKPQIINEVHVNPQIKVAPQIDLHVEMPLDDLSGSRPKGGKRPNQQPYRQTGNLPKLKNWAVGIEHGKCWWLFHWKEGVWQQRKKVAIPGGNATALMELLAEGGGAMLKAEARRKLQLVYPGADGIKLSAAITEALKKARQKIRNAIAQAAGCAYEEVSNPIPHDKTGWRAVIEIGYATFDEDLGKVIFQLEEDLH